MKQDTTLDQHFLNSVSTLLLEAKFANILPNETLLEIGAGDGRLSVELLRKKPLKLISIELDERYEEELSKLKSEFNNFELIWGNALEKIDSIRCDKLIANIPYNITEPLYEKILEKKIPYVQLLHGISFYKHILDESSKWHYFVKAFYEIELLKEVAGNAFEPPTKTMSTLISLSLKETLTFEEKFLQTLFLKRERNTKNALLFSLVDLGNTKKEAKEKIQELKSLLLVEEKMFWKLSNEELLKILNEIKEKKILKN